METLQVMLFSYRNNLLGNSDDLSKLKNRVWNTFEQLIFVYNRNCVTSFDLNFYDTAEILFYHVADKLGLDSTNKNGYSLYTELHDFLNSSQKINYVFDFIEAQLEVLRCKKLFSTHYLSNDIERVNLNPVYSEAAVRYKQVLVDLNLPYQLYKNHIVALIDANEIETIEKASNTKYDSINRHIDKAWMLFSDRKNPDYENSIKESISAVEAMCCIITGMTGAQATLGKALKKLKESGVHIHSAMENAFSSLYGYTSGENGIRHGGIDFTNAPEEDAKYMLISCSAFVNYLISKWEKAV